jgi:hypothetical protein
MSEAGDFELDESPRVRAAPAALAPRSHTPVAHKGSFWLGAAFGCLVAALVGLIVGLAVGLSGSLTTAPAVVDVTSLTLTPELVASNWTEVLRRARVGTVRWWFWGLDPQINAFVANTYGLPLQQEFGVQLESVQLNATFEAVDRVRTEVAAGNNASGAVDLIWINGDNFAAM